MTILLCTSFTHDRLYQVTLGRSRFGLACIATVYLYNAGTGVVGAEKAKVLGDKILNTKCAPMNTLSKEAQGTLIANIKEGRLSLHLLMDDVDRRITGIQVVTL